MPLWTGNAAAASLLSLPTVAGAPGSTVDLPISFTSGTGTTAGLQWTFAMPPGAVSFTVQGGPAATAAGKSLYCQGNICLVTGLNANTIGNGVVATVSVTLSPAAAGVLSIPLTSPVEALLDGSGAAITANSGSITVAAPVVSISLTPANVTLQPSQTQPFTASVTGSSNTGVTWSLSPNAGTISSTGFYTAPATVSAAQTVTLTATSAADPTKVATCTITLQPGAVAIRVNSGGPVYTDQQGKTWSADYGYTGGAPYQTAASILNTTTPPLYQTARSGDFQYQFAVPNGSYAVTLKFAELVWSQLGKRVFNVTINGTPALSAFDICAQAGGIDIASDLSFIVNVADSQMTISFTALTDSASVEAIEIVPSTSGSLSINPQRVTLTPSQSQQFTAAVASNSNAPITWNMSSGGGTLTAAGSYTAPALITTPQTATIKATNGLDTSKSATAVINLQPAPVTAFTPIRVNAGGPPYTDLQGQLWSADSAYTGGSVFSTSVLALNATDPVLYQSQRVGGMQYRFTVPNGGYTLKLKFAENDGDPTGKRVFDVVVNGATVLSRFDIVKQANGAFRAVDRSFPVNVTNGAISISFISAFNNAKISATEITAAP